MPTLRGVVCIPIRPTLRTRSLGGGYLAAHVAREEHRLDARYARSVPRIAEHTRGGGEQTRRMRGIMRGAAADSLRLVAPYPRSVPRTAHRAGPLSRYGARGPAGTWGVARDVG
eukprot:2671579-Rhodomonas_salina.1